jgi:hypothetical protein
LGQARPANFTVGEPTIVIHIDPELERILIDRHTRHVGANRSSPLHRIKSCTLKANLEFTRDVLPVQVAAGRLETRNRKCNEYRHDRKDDYNLNDRNAAFLILFRLSHWIGVNVSRDEFEETGLAGRTSYRPVKFLTHPGKTVKFLFLNDKHSPTIKETDKEGLFPATGNATDLAEVRGFKKAVL